MNRTRLSQGWWRRRPFAYIHTFLSLYYIFYILDFFQKKYFVPNGKKYSCNAYLQFRQNVYRKRFRQIYLSSALGCTKLI